MARSVCREVWVEPVGNHPSDIGYSGRAVVLRDEGERVLVRTPDGSDLSIHRDGVLEIPNA